VLPVCEQKETLPTLSLRIAGKSECQLQHIEPILPSGLRQYGELKPNIHCRTQQKILVDHGSWKIAMQAIDVPPAFDQNDERAV
jgi:hypothetical protein